MDATEPADDPLLTFLLRHETGLKPGGTSANGHEVMATYWSRKGEAVFAFCRDGLIIGPGTADRYVPFAEIEDAGYYNHDMIQRAKAARKNGTSGPLTIRLASGEEIDLPMNVRDDGMPDLLTIAHLIHRRAYLHQPKRAVATD